DWLGAAPRVRAWLDAARCGAPAGFDASMRRVAAVYADPGDWLAFTHGDPAPTNCHVAADGAVRLLDFEYGGFRHALYDETGWEMLCPLPRQAVGDVVDAYRATLGDSVPAARDGAAFAAAWAELCAYRGLAILTWIPPAVIDANRPWVEDWSAREAVLCVLSRLAHACAPHEPLAPVAEAARRLHGALHARWPEHEAEPAPQFPAFSA
ncbi:MAG TPA: hypothetical protein VKA84_17840, partial [Gemmatimonadaceae bacterium]|nr:hypothetical protein [Gemmatimonadaceae bacterium]